MIIIDTALKAREAAGNPIKVGMIGAGFMGRGLANQIIKSVPGMRLVAIANRSLEPARRAYFEAGIKAPVVVTTENGLDDVIRRGGCAITEDAMLVCRSEMVEAIIEVTGAVEFGAKVAMEAIEHGKHIILMNAELDGT